MPEKKTIERARRARRQGKAPSTAAGEFVHEEIEHVREGKHGARSTKQAIAIGLSKARRAGVPLKPPAKGRAKKATRQQARRDYAKGRSAAARKPSPKRARAARRALGREGGAAASRTALSRHARRVARRRGPKRKSP
ncbi:MAG: transcription elongation factor [Thermoanaerobaculia bacterium]